MQNDIERVLLSEDELKVIVSDMGKKISEDYKGKKLILVSVLKGSVIFMGDLMRAITI
ncbi:MAG: hypoxanthine phosphoribosyltransferase, partial [Oscillospiraceae bacterium]